MTHCVIPTPPGQICRYCNELHSPYVVEIPQGWNKKDILVPLFIFVAILAIGIIVWVARTYVKPGKSSGNSIKDRFPKLDDGWWYDDGMLRYKDF